MAVSGRKVSDFSGSVYESSAENFDHSCDRLNTEAHRFCVECQQYLCQSCIAYHHRITATKNHQLHDMDNVDNQNTANKDTTVCTERCNIHKNEIIKFYCTNHKFLGCSDCITMNHRTCKIDYIPDKCTDIGDSDEYSDTLKKLGKKIKDIDAIIEESKQQNNEIDFSHDMFTQEVSTFRKEINDHFDLLEMKLEEKARKHKYKNKETIAKVLKACTSVSSDMKEMLSSLQDSKTSEENLKTYILTKQAQLKLRTDDVMSAKESLEQAAFQYTFERNKELENFLTKMCLFGTMSLSPTKKASRKKKEFDKLKYKGNIHVKTKSDKGECRITACAFLCSAKIVLADMNNSKLKVLNTERKLVTEEKKLDSKPHDIAVLPQEKIAVTVPDIPEILVLTAVAKLSIIRKIPVRKGECRGIAYHQDHLYVVCWYPNYVLIADTQGNIRNSIDLENKIVRDPNYILLNKDSKHKYVSNFGSDSVISVTLPGDISAVYKHADLNEPRGMVMLDDGSLLVCCGNGTIHHISRDLKQGQILQKGLENPKSICYNQHKQEFYIGGNSDQLMIMK